MNLRTLGFALFSTNGCLDYVPSAMFLAVERGGLNFKHNSSLMAAVTIHEHMQPFFQKMKLREDLIVAQAPTSLTFGSVGSNFFTQGDLAIYLSTELCETDHEACYFMIKHEVSHIKHEDFFIMWTAATVTALSLATLAQGKQTRLNNLQRAAIIGAMAYLVKTACSQYIEGRADSFAIAESSLEEIKGGRRFLTAVLQTHLENSFSFQHPTLHSRIAKIDLELEKQGVQIDNEVETKKIDAIMTLFKH